MVINKYMFQVTNPAKEQIEEIKKGVEESIKQSSRIHNTDMIVNYDKYYEEEKKNND